MRDLNNRDLFSYSSGAWKSKIKASENLVFPQAFLFVPSKSLFPVLCKFWWLYGGVNGDLLQESLCHTQVCCTQNPCPCGSPLLTYTSTGDTQIQFCLSLCGVSGSYCAQGFFEHSEHLWGYGV